MISIDINNNNGLLLLINPAMNMYAYGVGMNGERWTFNGQCE